MNRWRKQHKDQEILLAFFMYMACFDSRNSRTVTLLCENTNANLFAKFGVVEPRDPVHYGARHADWRIDNIARLKSE